MQLGLTDAGFNPKRDYIGVSRREGYFAMFRQRDQENARGVSARPQERLPDRKKTGAPAFDAVDNIIGARTRALASRCAWFSIPITCIRSCSSS